MSAPLGPGAPDENAAATPAPADPLQLNGPELEPEDWALAIGSSAKPTATLEKITVVRWCQFSPMSPRMRPDRAAPTMKNTSARATTAA